MNIKGIIGEDYEHAKRVWKDIKLKNLGDYHDLHTQDDTISLANVSEDFQNKCIELYKLGPTHVLSAPGHQD